jgi:hypothetical protein
LVPALQSQIISVKEKHSSFIFFIFHIKETGPPITARSFVNLTRKNWRLFAESHPKIRTLCAKRGGGGTARTLYKRKGHCTALVMNNDDSRALGQECSNAPGTGRRCRCGPEAPCTRRPCSCTRQGPRASLYQMKAYIRWMILSEGCCQMKAYIR